MKRLITEQDLERLGKGATFQVEPQMIVTPSARDFAAQHQITLAYASGRAGQTEESALDRAIKDIVASELGRSDPALVEAVRAELAHVGVASAEPPTDLTPVAGPIPVPLPRDPGGNRAVITATGINRTGILGRLTTAVSKLGGDIQDVSQTIVAGYFTMILVVELGEARRTTFDAFRAEVLGACKELGLQGVVMHEDVLKAMHRV